MIKRILTLMILSGLLMACKQDKKKTIHLRQAHQTNAVGYTNITVDQFKEKLAQSTKTSPFWILHPSEVAQRRCDWRRHSWRPTDAAFTRQGQSTLDKKITPTVVYCKGGWQRCYRALRSYDLGDKNFTICRAATMHGKHNNNEDGISLKTAG